MARPDVTQAVFEVLEDQGEAGWLVRVSIAGEGFVSRALPLIAEVGEVPVRSIAIIGGGAVGFLSSVPPAGARLRVGYLDHGLHDTEFTFGEETEPS
jgi:hypothetical protein